MKKLKPIDKIYLKLADTNQAYSQFSTDETPSLNPEFADLIANLSDDNSTKNNVEIKVNSKIKAIELDHVVIDVLDNQGNPISEEKIYCDFVVNALASVKNKLNIELDESKKIIDVGDCLGDRPSNIDHAIKSAYDAANSID